MSTEVFVFAPKPNRETDWPKLNSLARWIVAAKKMYLRRGQWRALFELDDHLLADIGLTREQAEQEGRKPFWE
jgi:uncharacterized protein YjiS (DUF1127 family)